MKSILLPTDFTDTTTAAIDWARLFARKTGASITLLHVYQPMLADTTLPAMGDMGVGMAASHDLEIIGQHRLTELADELQTAGFAAQADWRMGSIDDEIMAAARQYGADLIIAGHSGIRTIFDRLAGSVADEVAHAATCPVLVLPQLTDTDLHLPAQVRSILYAMQPDSSQAEMSDQLSDLTDAFDVPVDYKSTDEVGASSADLIVVTDYKKGGLFSTNPADRVLSTAKVPVLVFHPKKS